ncbi:MAG: SAM-dependent methyltransferase [Ruminococcaceae bacterium]|nr:SAM-dependent methyltransferase [Oscillospiraceae bacterium]
MRPLFTLNNRLQLCAEMVRKGSRIADIGTDHAYLPVWLVRAGFVSFALACDIKAEPLKAGRLTISKYHAEDKVETRLCDGLRDVRPQEVDDIVIAGMGGETIVHILSEASWLKDKSKRLVLQPMSKHELVIAYLYEQGFELTEHRCTVADGKIYTAFSAQYTGAEKAVDEVFCYVGLLKAEDENDRRFILSTLNHLDKKSKADPHFGEIAEIIRERFSL